MDCLPSYLMIYFSKAVDGRARVVPELGARCYANLILTIIPVIKTKFYPNPSLQERERRNERTERRNTFDFLKMFKKFIFREGKGGRKTERNINV